MTDIDINLIDQALSQAQWDLLCADTPQEGMIPEHCLTMAGLSINNCLNLLAEVPAEETELQRITLWFLIEQWGQMDDIIAGRDPMLPSRPISAPSVEELDVHWEAQ